MRVRSLLLPVFCLGITLFSGFTTFASDSNEEAAQRFPTSYFYSCKTIPNSGTVYLWHQSRIDKHPVTRQLLVVWERHVEFSKELQALTEMSSAPAESMGGDFNLEINAEEYFRLVSLNRRAQNYDRLEIRTTLPTELQKMRGMGALKDKTEKPRAYLLAWQGDNLKWSRALSSCTTNTVNRSPIRFNEL